VLYADTSFCACARFLPVVRLMHGVPGRHRNRFCDGASLYCGCGQLGSPAGAFCRTSAGCTCCFALLMCCMRQGLHVVMAAKCCTLTLYCASSWHSAACSMFRHQTVHFGNPNCPKPGFVCVGSSSAASYSGPRPAQLMCGPSPFCHLLLTLFGRLCCVYPSNSAAGCVVGLCILCV
jgi:hypothetical protein